METAQPFPLYGREYKRDPYPTYLRLRNEGAVHRVQFPSGVLGWLVTGYDPAIHTLTDSRLGKNHSLGNEAWRKLAAIMPEPQHSLLQVHLLHQDPPKHTSMRSLVLEAFAPRRVSHLRPRFEQIARNLLDAIHPAGEAELINSFCVRFSFAVLSEVIGLPADYQRRFRREWCKVVQPVGPQDPRRAHYIGLLEELQGYINDLITLKRRAAEDDLLSELVEANNAGGLTDAELSSMIFQLLVAGQEPVTNQISTALVTLLGHPEQLAQLQADPDLLPAAVEECFRFDTAFELTTWRFFKQPTEYYGVQIPAGDSVIVSLAAANRDSRRFSCPDAFDVTRSPNPHLSFGHGIHYCPGAALGRLEVQVALEALIDRLPRLRLAVPPDHLEWIPAVLGRGVERLPVTFTPRH